MNGIYIEITNSCNLKCSFCPSHTLQERRFMDKALFIKCLEQAENVAENVYFHILGEPTIHPQFLEFLKILEHSRLKLNLTTNGTTIAERGEALLQCPNIRQINFSTHAYAELPRGLAEKHLKSVLDFSKKAIETRPELYLNLRLWNVGDENSKEWNEYMLKCVNGAFETQIEMGHFCSRHKSFLVKERLYLHEDSRFEWPEMPTENAIPHAKGTCRALDTHVGILSNGCVVACCLDYQGKILLGNIDSKDLSDILQSSVALSLKEGFAKKELRHPLCRNCSFCKRFK